MKRLVNFFNRYEIPQSLREAWRLRGIGGWTALQEAAWGGGLLDSRESWLIAGPASAGKGLMAEAAAAADAFAELQRLRDEAHRFAITHHRGLRDAQMTRSALDDVPGIGPARRTALLKHFTSVQEMARASVEELAAVPGMSRAAAEALLRHLTKVVEE